MLESWAAEEAGKPWLELVAEGTFELKEVDLEAVDKLAYTLKHEQDTD